MRIFFGRRKERAAFENFKSLVDIVCDTVKKYEELVGELYKGNLKRAKELGTKINELESLADEHRTDIEITLSEGAFMPRFRGDLLSLAEKVDLIADTTEEAMREILRRERLFEVFRMAMLQEKNIECIMRDFVVLSKSVIATLEPLRDGINELDIDVNESLKCFERVEELEHEVRDREEVVMKDVFDYEYILDAVSIQQLKSAIELTRKIARDAEDASDVATLISITYKT